MTRCCPSCAGSALVRAVAQPPYNLPRHRRAATTFRCVTCDALLFELLRPHPAGLLTGEQLETWLAAHALPVARLRRR